MNLAERLLKTVGCHFVTLSCVQHPPGGDDEHIFVASGFVVDAGSEWFYVTAGHILKRIQLALDAGSTFDTWRFDDQTAGHDFKVSAIPFVFDIESWVVIEDEEVGLDYAVVPLDMMVRLQMKAGRVVPIGKDAWGDHLLEHDHWALVGIPSETVAYDKKSLITARITVMPLVEAAQPAQAGDKAKNQFYARINDIGHVTDIAGMSGGPVFTLKKLGAEWRYKVIGVQSGWYPSTRTIAACPFVSLGLALEEVVESLKASHVGSNAT